VYRLFSWEHSYFSGKARAYLRYKQRCGGLGPGFEDVLATPELILGLLVPRSGSNAVPQLETPDGAWVQDTSEIVDFCEAQHPEPAVVPRADAAPRQRLAAYLVELLADEWMVVPAFWEPGAPGPARRAAGAAFFESAFGIADARSDPRGVYAGLVHLGVTERTEHAWQASQHRLLGLLEAHFAVHDFVLGGRPSLADFGLLGPLYAHLYRDAVSGFALRAWFPLVCEWVERTNGEGALNARSYGQRLYSLGPDGNLIGRPATSDAGEWLPDDRIAETLLPVLGVFFEEMWPVLRSSLEVLRDFVASDAHAPGAELPGKTFTATPGFEEHQTGQGALTHEFEIGGVRERRMVVPYQVWMLQRLADVLRECTASADGRAAVEGLLEPFEHGRELLELDALLAGSRVRKEGGRLYSEAG
jgi:glutathione S-transferase